MAINIERTPLPYGRVDKTSYVSPFRKIDDYDKAFESQPYNGTMMQVLDELEFQLRLPREDADPVILALHPPRVMRGVMDYFVETQRPSGKVFLTRKAVRLGLTLNNNLEVLRYLHKFKRAAVLSGHSELFTFPVTQIKDKLAWDSTRPERSSRSAEGLLAHTGGQDILFIPLGHGGVPAGLDVFEYYKKLTGTSHSLFYPVRFSMKKKNDKDPRVNMEEVAFLRQGTIGRVPAIFDEDTITGETIINAYSFFLGLLGPELGNRKLLQLTNLKMNVQVSEN